ncbi:MAG: DMT family transporter [Bacteroidetes bacterium]|nr:DMT family transporter [Bacteroidota bacterium]
MNSIRNYLNSDRNLIIVYKAELILLFVTLTWGLSFPLIKIALGSVSPVLFNFLRFTLTLILFLIFYRNKLKGFRLQDLKNGLLLGTFLFLGFALQAAGLYYTTASKSAFITGTNLIFIPFIQFAVLKTRPKLFNMIGALIVITGLFILSESYDLNINTGDILTLFCAVFFAVHIVFLDKFSRKSDINILIFGQFLVSAVLSLLFSYFYEYLFMNEFRFTPDATLITAIIYTSVFSTFIGIVLMTKYQRMTTPLRAGIIYNMESIFAVFFAYIILTEIMNFNQIIGAVIMISGLLISEFSGLLKLNTSVGKKN